MNPAWLIHFNPNTPDTQTRIAIAVRQDPDDLHWHAGVIYRNPNDRQLHLLHLGWHHSFRDEPPSSEYSYVAVQDDPRKLTVLARFCETVSRRYTRGGPSIPYALRYDKTRFDASGTLVLGQDEFGLTCSTFPLALLESAGLKVVEVNTWPAARPADLEFQKYVAAQLSLSKRLENQAHAAKVQAELGCIRVRPQETAGACSSLPYPCDFSRARAAADQIEAAFASR